MIGGKAASEVALWGRVCNFKSACSVGAAYVAVPLPHGGDSACWWKTDAVQWLYMVPFLCVRHVHEFLWKPNLSELWSRLSGHYINRLWQNELHQFDVLTHVCKLILIDMSVSEHREIRSYKVMCRTVVKEKICCSTGIFGMVTRQAVLLCVALWRVVNLCHLGTIGSTYCSRFMCLWHLEHTASHTVSMNESQISLSSLAGSLWYDVCIPAHLFSTGTHSHLWFSTYPLHSLCIPAYLSLSILLSLFAKYSTLPGSPKRQTAGGHA